MDENKQTSNSNNNKYDLSVQPNSKIDELNADKLDKIKKELKEEKDTEGKRIIRLKVFFNILIAIFIVIYFALILIGSAKIPTIQYLRDLKFFVFLDLIVAIVLFEKSINSKNQSEFLFLNGIEITIVGIITLFIVDLFNKQSSNLNLFVCIAIEAFVFYYFIKSLIIIYKNK